MNLKYYLILTLAFAFNSVSPAQIIVDSKAQVKNIDFYLVGEDMVITYDLLNTKPSEKYKINISIFTQAGKKIDAKTFTGDVGENITGGYHKTITWKMSEDITYLNDQIYVEIEAINENPRIIQPTGKGKALLLSTIYPGWGSAKTTLKGAHALKGVLGYLCIAGAVSYNKRSGDTYNSYQEASTTSERDRLYNQTIDEFQKAQILAIAAGTVWLWDYVTVLAAPNRSKQKGFKSQILSIRPGLDPVYNFPNISLVLNF